MTRRSMVVSAILAMVITLLVSSGYAAKVDVFSGEAAEAQLKPWGNGKISLGGESYKGSKSLQIETRGYHEGGYYKLSKPLDLSPYLSSPGSSHLVVYMKIGRSGASASGRRSGRRGRGGMRRMPGGGGMPGMPGGGGMPGMPGMPGAMPGAMPGLPGMGGANPGPSRIEFAQSSDLYYAQLPGLPGMPGAGGMPGMPGGMPGAGGMPGMPGGMPGAGMGMPGMPGAGAAPGMGMPGMGTRGRTRRGSTVSPPRPLESVRVTLITDQGQIDAGAFHLPSMEKDGDWGQARVPFSKMKGVGLTEGAKLQAVVFTGNAEGSFFIAGVELAGG